MIPSNYRIKRKDFYFICLIFLSALFFRIMYFRDYVKTDVYPMLSFSDGYFYYLRANDILSGDFFNGKIFLSWPLYGYFLALLFKISANSISGAYLFQFILGAVQCVLVYFIARKLFNEYAGFLAGLICAWYGWFIFYDGLLIYTSLSLFLNSVLFLYLLYSRERPDGKNLFFFGILSGICAAAQGNVIIFSFFAAIWVLWQKKVNFINGLGLFCFFIMGLGIVIGLPMARNYFAEKKIAAVSLNTGLNFYLGNNSASPGIFYCPDYFGSNQEDMLRDARIIARASMNRQVSLSGASYFWCRKALDFIRNNPQTYSKLLFRKIAYLLNPNEFSCELEFQMIRDKIRIFKILFMDLRFIFPFAFLGIILNIRRPKDAAPLYLALISISLCMLIFFVTAKLKVALAPFLAVFAASGIYSLWASIRERKFIKFFGLSLLSGLLIFLFNCDLFIANKAGYAGPKKMDYNAYIRRAQFYEEKSDYKKALEELEIAERIKPNDRFIALSFGEFYYKLKDFKKAERQFRQALAIFPYYLEAYYNLGFLYNLQGRFDEAEIVLKRGVFLDPEDPGCRFELGRAYKAKGDFKKAKEEFNLASNYIARWRKQDRELIEKELGAIK